MEMGGEGGSGRSVLAARHDDDHYVTTHYQLYSTRISWIPCISLIFFSYPVFAAETCIPSLSLVFYRLCLYSDIRGSLNKFPDFYRMGTFIDSTHMKL